MEVNKEIKSGCVKKSEKKSKYYEFLMQVDVKRFRL